MHPRGVAAGELDVHLRLFQATTSRRLLDEPGQLVQRQRQLQLNFGRTALQPFQMRHGPNGLPPYTLTTSYTPSPN